MTIKMIEETLQAPAVVERQLLANASLWQEISQRLKKIDIPYILTVARGSSDHAATFAKYLFETQLGLTTASAAPSVITLYKSRQKLKNCLIVALSQSGESPDICEVLSVARELGAITLALVNRENSPLAKIAEYVVPLYAGEEQSVAATKSYLAMLTALLQGCAVATDNSRLLHCLTRLPELLNLSCQMDWSTAAQLLRDKNDLLILGRGFGFPIALEAALKCKETSALHAEGFSSAEVQHGPLALVHQHFPIFLFCQDDESFETNRDFVYRLHHLDSRVFLALPENLITAELKKVSTILALPPSIHGLLDPLAGIQAFYLLAAELAQLRGYNPDQPANLQKVTRTK